MQSQVSNRFVPITLLHPHCALVKLSLGRVLPGQFFFPFPPLQSKSRVSSNLFRSRVLQMNPPQLTRDYLTDGYISYTFTSRNAEFYVDHLFRRDAASVQAIRDGNGAYSVLIPPSHFSLPIRTQYGDTWVLDHAVRTGGSVVPQQLWAPQGQGDQRRYMDQVQFRMPIFIVNMNRGLGIPVMNAAAGHMQLRDAYLPLSLMHKTTINIGIGVCVLLSLSHLFPITYHMVSQWPGYPPAEHQVQLTNLRIRLPQGTLLPLIGLSSMWEAVCDSF